MKLTLEFNIDQQFLKDLLTTCYEGGSAYWLACNIAKRDRKLNVIKIEGCFDVEDGSTEWGDATLETMLLGIERMMTPGANVNVTTKMNILTSVIDPNECRWDADDADAVLQFGLLGELVYG